MAQEGKVPSWADVLAAVGSGGGALAKLLGTSTGGDSTILSSIMKGGTAAFKYFTDENYSDIASGDYNIDYSNIAGDDWYNDTAFPEYGDVGDYASYASGDYGYGYEDIW